MGDRQFARPFGKRLLWEGRSCSAKAAGRRVAKALSSHASSPSRAVALSRGTMEAATSDSIKILALAGFLGAGVSDAKFPMTV